MGGRARCDEIWRIESEIGRLRFCTAAGDLLASFEQVRQSREEDLVLKLAMTNLCIWDLRPAEQILLRRFVGGQRIHQLKSGRLQFGFLVVVHPPWQTVKKASRSTALSYTALTLAFSRKRNVLQLPHFVRLAFGHRLTMFRYPQMDNLLYVLHIPSTSSRSSRCRHPPRRT